MNFGMANKNRPKTRLENAASIYILLSPPSSIEVSRNYFGVRFMVIRFFPDPVRVLSIGCNSIQVLLIRADLVRVMSIRSDPIRSGFCKRPKFCAFLLTLRLPVYQNVHVNSIRCLFYFQCFTINIYNLEKGKYLLRRILMLLMDRNFNSFAI